MMQLFGIKDRKAEAFVHYYTSPTSATALRTFDVMTQDEGSMLSKHAEDYELFLLASINQDTGDTEGQCPPKRVTDGAVVRSLRVQADPVPQIPLSAPKASKRRK